MTAATSTEPMKIFEYATTHYYLFPDRRMY